ncbi:MAG: hypothetical protein ACP5E5_11305 [Acidobacteriaceae bacterium]
MKFEWDNSPCHGAKEDGAQPVPGEPAQGFQEREARTSNQEQNNQDAMGTEMPEIIEVVVALEDWVDDEE